MVLFLLPLLMRTALVPPVIFALTGRGVCRKPLMVARHWVSPEIAPRISERIVIAVELNGGICRDGAAGEVIERVADGDVDAV